MMKNNNSKNIKDQNPPSSPASQKSKLLQLSLQFGRIMFSLLGLVCSCVFLYMLLTSGFTKIFDPSVISTCRVPHRYYLSKITTLQKLVLILNAISILLFCLILFLSIATAFTGGNKKQSHQNVLLIMRMVFVFMAILSVGCLFGNCIKTIVGLKNVYDCATENMKYSVQYFYRNTQTLAVLSGLSLMAALFVLFTHPCSIQIEQIPLRNKNQEMYRQKNNLDLEQKSVDALITPRNKYPIEINLGNTPNLQIPNHNKKPRIFNKQFLAQSRYGLSSYKTKQLQQSKNQTQNKQIYVDKSQVSFHKNVQPKQILVDRQSINIQINKPQNIRNRKQQNNSSDHGSRDHLMKENVSQKQDVKQIQYHAYRSPRQIESNLVKLSDEKPPLQLGHYFPENQKVVFVYEKSGKKNQNNEKNQELQSQQGKIQIKKKSQIFGSINSSNGKEFKPHPNIFS